ncbi:MAG: serine hydrolase [Candidatus Promineifilaceae bacterium]|nr:serine hydrolase [Candidatus Promineifilaceae bacterium]
MNKSNSAGLGQWITVTVMVSVSLFLLVKLYQFAGSRSFYPVGLTVGGVDVGGMTPDQASEILTNRFIEAPIVLHHGEENFEISPSRAEFTPDIPAMLSQADFQRTQQDFWAGFWGYLWGRPVEVEPVELQATHNREALQEVLREIASLADEPAQPPQPVPSTLSFQYGTSGIRTDIDASLADIEAALYRSSNREASLVFGPYEPERPAMNLLTRLLVNLLQVFEQETGGVASVFIMDLQTGQVVPINENVAMSGIDLMRIPIVLGTYRSIDNLPTLTQRQLISDTLVSEPENTSANELLYVIAEDDDPYQGAVVVSEMMQRLGLVNSYMAAPYDEPLRAGNQLPKTPANSVEELRTRPDPEIQTTAEDIGILLSMIYYCAQGQGGALVAAFPDQISQEECTQTLDYMRQNKIGSLIEEGVPPDTPIAHRHGWISDTHGDAAIISTPGGDYVVVSLLYKPDWLEWEISSPLFADISRATYNYFNFDEPFLGETRSN